MKPYLIVLLCFSMLLAGCVGSPIHSTLKYDSIQKKIKRNNDALLELQAGMMRDQVQEIMGRAERSEGYPWGSAWLYRTAMTSGIYGTADTDFTPVIFDQNGILQGWGRNYFEQYVNKYELTIKQEK